jgi:hypothetical protein
VKKLIGIALIILICCFVAACQLTMMGGHGAESTERNWSKPGSLSEQTAADLENCKERSGYNHQIIFSTWSLNMYHSFVENCMGRLGYEWHREGYAPIGGGASPSGQSTGGAITVRPLNQ